MTKKEKLEELKKESFDVHLELSNVPNIENILLLIDRDNKLSKEIKKLEKSLKPKIINQVGFILSDLSEKSIKNALDFYDINDGVGKEDREGGKIETIYVCDINDMDNVIAVEAEWEAEWYGEWSMRCFVLSYPKLISTKKLEHKYSISNVCEYEEDGIRGDFTIKIEIPNI